MKKIIIEPYKNKYCNKCIYCDGEDVESLRCRKLRYLNGEYFNCRQFIRCAYFVKKVHCEKYEVKVSNKNMGIIYLK